MGNHSTPETAFKDIGGITLNGEIQPPIVFNNLGLCGTVSVDWQLDGSLTCVSQLAGTLEAERQLSSTCLSASSESELSGTIDAKSYLRGSLSLSGNC